MNQNPLVEFKKKEIILDELTRNGTLQEVYPLRITKSLRIIMGILPGHYTVNHHRGELGIYKDIADSMGGAYSYIFIWKIT